MGNKTKRLVFMGVCAALVCVATLVIRIPSALGYKNLGDVIIVFASIFFGPFIGGVTGGIGAALADVIGGYASYAPFTFVIKALMGLIAGFLFRLFARLRFQFHASVIISAIPAALAMAAGYFVTNCILYGEPAAALIDFTGDLLQGAIGVAGGSALVFVLDKVPSIENVCGSSATMQYRHFASKGRLHKKAVVISDLSGLGRCSLAAQIPIISAMGHEAVCLPTAVLSAQTAFDGYKILPLPTALNEFPAHWEKIGFLPSAMLTGYIADTSQLKNITALAGSYKDKGVQIVTDPIMGDDGKLYNGFSNEIVEEFKQLASYASVITPNLTEACLLADENYQNISSMTDKKTLFAAVFALGDKLANGDLGCKKVVITGVKFGKRIYNFVIDGKAHNRIGSAYSGGLYSGTGDILSAVVTGCVLCGYPLKKGVRKAARLISHAISDTRIENTPPTEGINYQRYLYLL